MPFIQTSDKNLLKKRIFYGLQLAGILLWLSNLKYTNGYYSVYVLCALSALYCMYADHRDEVVIPRKVLVSGLVLSSLLALAVVAANYPAFQRVRDPGAVSPGSNRLMNLLELGATFLGGIPVAYHCLRHLYVISTTERRPLLGRASGNRPVVYFFAVYGIITAVDILYLFTTVYPGCVSHDSMWQIYQLYTGEFNNRLPYWYTRFIGVILSLGYGMFGEVNRAVAFYSCVQILMMAAIFSYTLLTLYQRKASWFTLGIGFCFYCFMPYNMAFSTSMWKDVLFTGSILLTITAQYRILKDVGNPVGNRINLLLGGIGVCLMRTNGWYVMLISLVILLLCGKEIRRKLAILMAAVVAVGFFMNIPMIRLLNVKGIDKVETLSLPLQQIGRVIVQGREINPEDQALLNQVLDLEKVPEDYMDWTSDPMKNQVWAKNPQYVFEHTEEFVSLWLRLGAKYPQDYFEAWVELTKGYWNGGYDYYIYAEYVADNDYGIAMDQSMNPVKQILKAYFALTRESILFEPILSIGLHVWAAAGLLWVMILGKRKEAVLFIPLFVILAGLWIGSPVFSEFRYAYPVCAAMPFLAPICVTREE